MVTPNGTLLVELLLFLAFLWLLNRIILRPMLRLLDERDATVETDRETAETVNERAQRAEASYAKQLSRARRHAGVRGDKARRQATDERNAALTARRREADQAIEDSRAESQKQVADQRDQYPRLVDELAEAIGRQVQAGGPSR